MNLNLDSHLESKLVTFFNSALKEMYWSEQHLVNVLDTMSQSATDEKLKSAFEEHKSQTQAHVQRLEQAFEMLGLLPEVKMSRGLQGLFDEGWQVIDETDESTAQRDAALIIAAQKVEHYEIACYGSLKTLATTLNKPDLADLFNETLSEEKETGVKLTEIAEAGINEDAGNEQRDEDYGKSSADEIVVGLNEDSASKD